MLPGRARLHRLLSTARRGDTASRVVDLLIIALIGADLVAFTCASIPDLDRSWHRLFQLTEVVVLLAFTIEYVLRLYACTADPRYRGPLGRLRYAVTPMALVDLVAILPFLSFIPALHGNAVPVELTTVRGLRLLRLLKVARYSHSLRILARAIWRIRAELAVIASMLCLMLFIASSLLYSLEHEEQPDVFRSIPEAMWYSVVVMTTLGLGDITVVTPAGKLLSGLLAIAGIATFAVPAGLLGAAFVEEFRRAQFDDDEEQEPTPVVCPYCRHWFYASHEHHPATPQHTGQGPESP